MNLNDQVPVEPQKCLCIHALDGFETYKIDENTIGVRAIWYDARTNPPKKKGRYLIMTTFINPCKSLDCIVREDVPFVSNYLPEKGWLSKCDEHVITHWMEIPPRV